ncbi:phytoene desaturase family protein [Paracrocinitomix mangrovi]|uniref:phytoene desaturase family protein n=1 Tax=Paracrocinitomix mangrovi TaxID=2862509 RepID=UPI001C8E0470|nr:phytoene desaturase family protein [Paracrocinitomix mangrovi]UKN03614.1 phytoene desaturase family protein [Paracrocinitomix mangrovi]
MSSAVKYDTVVIGGGISGIAAALRRKAKGESVLLLEKNEKLGGKLDELKWNGYRWDKGPSLFTLPHLVDELFELFGKNPADYFKYITHYENTRYIFGDRTKLTLFTEKEKRKASLQEVFSTQEVDAVENYLQKVSSTYQSIGDLFIDRPKLSFKDALKLEVVKQYPKVISTQMMSSLDGYNRKTLKHPKLVQLFNRFGTYNGSDPYKMSGLYSMIPHLELNIGTYFPIGGMRAIINALVKLCHEVGVDVKLNQTDIEVDQIEEGYLVNLKDESVKSKNLICSIDHLNFYKSVLKDNALFAKHAKEERSSSAIVFYWAIDKHFDEIGLHNILFSDDYKSEFHQLFDLAITPLEPTIYIHNSSAIEKMDAPEGCQNWFVMIHTPAGIEVTDQIMDKARDFIKARVKHLLDIDIENHIAFEDSWNMQKVERVTGSYKGALYGGAFNSKLSSFKRHGNKSKKYKNLYFTGGSVHPGGGIPLVLKSAKIVDELMDQNG